MCLNFPIFEKSFNKKEIICPLFTAILAIFYVSVRIRGDGHPFDSSKYNQFKDFDSL